MLPIAELRAENAGLVAVFSPGVKPTPARSRPVLGACRRADIASAACVSGFALPTRMLSAHRVVVGVVVGEAAHQVDDGAPRLGVGDAHEGLVELQAVAAAQELDDGVLGRLLGKPVGHGRLRLAGGSLLVEELYRHAQHLREIEQPAGADAVDALLVLLDLLEREAQLLAELFLAHAEQHAAKADAAADVHVDRIGPSRALLVAVPPVDETGCSRHDSPVRVALDPQLVGADVNAVNLRGLCMSDIRQSVSRDCRASRSRVGHSVPPE